jgi:lipoprotein-anchoring transpeptidase ErfK/SrfK
MPVSQPEQTTRSLRRWGLLLAGAACLASPAAQALTEREVNEAQFAAGQKPAADAVDPVILRAQVLLDRLDFSPGSIDGRTGDNFTKALDAFATANGLPASGTLTPEVWSKLVATYDGPVLVSYKIRAEDVAGPFKPVPEGFEAMAEEETLGYASAKEELAETFHMSPGLLEALNPDAGLDRAGERILVAAARPEPAKDAISNRNAVPAKGGKAVVVRVEVDKSAHALRGFDAENRLVAFYPASIGSDDKPAPSGRFEIKAIARSPTYTYNPDYKFKGVKTREKLTIPAGPNNPVGVVWLDLTAESYGIHGTPEPERVGKTYSHGCIRLTNWDVKDLASRAGKGTAVEFRD